MVCLAPRTTQSQGQPFVRFPFRYDELPCLVTCASSSSSEAFETSWVETDVIHFGWKLNEKINSLISNPFSIMSSFMFDVSWRERKHKRQRREIENAKDFLLHWALASQKGKERRWEAQESSMNEWNFVYCYCFFNTFSNFRFLLIFSNWIFFCYHKQKLIRINKQHKTGYCWYVRGQFQGAV